MLIRRLYLFLGFFFLALAILGIFLPLVPTTPFVLIAAACFGRSSEKWHNWLRNNSTFGPMLHNWQINRCLTLRVKTFALLSMLMAGGYSIFFAIADFSLRIIGGILIALGFFAIISTKTCEAREDNG
ncbi:MAG TPA: DUF454 domain-containing protein [Gammaproteobacteria bacterium]|nr:DUF454 domain-containing protein [Gammaproteobacteria bacterium]|tara:strand:- start:4047 stop:4430 length:384 start_codon:yes stop_codon:yes gene_type:complete